MVEGRHYYGAEQRLRAVVEALDVSGLAEEAYKEFRSQKEQVAAPLPRKMALRYEGERLGVLVDGTIVAGGD